jgi:hypothetical protein
MSEILRLTKAIQNLALANEQYAPDPGIRCRHRVRHNERLMLDRAEIAIKSINRMFLRGQITTRQKTEMIKNVQKFVRKG